MYKTASLIFFLFFLSCRLNAQIFPKEGSKLHYRLIGFSCPAQTWAVKYKIEIADGTYTSDSDFEKNKISTTQSNTAKVIVEVPFFGRQYTWRIVFITRDETTKNSILYHFSTRYSPDVDSTITRLRILNSAAKYKDAYVFLDGTRVLYDMKGKPVWFLPGSDENNRDVYPRDLKITSAGTITFTTGFQPYEISYSGDLLWRYTGNKPGQPIDSFHHEFTRLANGHYMGMIYDYKPTLLQQFKDSIAHNAADSARYYCNTQYNAIVEYDKDNHLIWRWGGWQYEHNSDLAARNPGKDPSWNHDLHENSCYFDEKKSVVYLSFRNINRVIKIKYPEGNILNTYGALYNPNNNWANGLFCNQHSCRLSQQGYLYLFNNNTCGASHLPGIIMMQEPPAGKNDLKKIWEYQCSVEDKSISKDDLYFHSGGNVLELPDRSMFVSMSIPYCKVFIVSHDKKILWSAVTEKFDTLTQKWSPPIELYRASIITSRKQLEQLIWNAEK